MPTNSIDPTLDGVAAALTVHARRHLVLATNIANVETPGFRAQDTDFRAALRTAFERSLEGGEPPRASHLLEDTSATPRADGNTVDVDLQMAKLSDNSTRYIALARILGRRIGLLRQAIDGSR